MREQPTDRRAIDTIDGGKHLVRIIPSDAAGPHGCDTLCGMTLHAFPHPGVLEFGPGLPDEAERPDGMCATCWRALCRSGCWKRESWSLSHGPLDPVPELLAAPKPKRKRKSVVMAEEQPDPDDPNIWKL